MCSCFTCSLAPGSSAHHNDHGFTTLQVQVKGGTSPLGIQDAKPLHAVSKKSSLLLQLCLCKTFNLHAEPQVDEEYDDADADAASITSGGPKCQPDEVTMSSTP